AVVVAVGAVVVAVGAVVVVVGDVMVVVADVMVVVAVVVVAVVVVGGVAAAQLTGPSQSRAVAPAPAAAACQPSAARRRVPPPDASPRCSDRRGGGLGWSVTGSGDRHGHETAAASLRPRQACRPDSRPGEGRALVGRDAGPSR
ncbi:MAG: hypothetical protein ACRD0L_08845, partial [Acidimicrobiales bacterium]